MLGVVTALWTLALFVQRDRVLHWLSPEVLPHAPVLLVGWGLAYTLLAGAQVPTVRSIIAALIVLLGMVLGMLRNRFNTSTAMLAHAVYNSTLALLAALAGQFLINQ